MSTLKELWEQVNQVKKEVQMDNELLSEAEAVTIASDIVKKVYHRDYLKTKDKPYRKYKKKTSQKNTTTKKKKSGKKE